MVAKRHKITNVPLFKKLWDIIFFFWDNNFLSHFSGHFEGASTFLTPKLSLAAPGTIYGVKKVLAPSKCPSKRLKKLLYKNYVPQFLKQRDINSFLVHTSEISQRKNISIKTYYRRTTIQVHIHVHCTATKTPLMYSFSGNCVASVPISTFLCL
jgi:hypothetical protein